MSHISRRCGNFERMHLPQVSGSRWKTFAIRRAPQDVSTDSQSSLPSQRALNQPATRAAARLPPRKLPHDLRRMWDELGDLRKRLLVNNCKIS